MKNIKKIIKRIKNRNGFTLVELIVVLVILGILIAMLVPALTGYIRRAHEKRVMAECRQAVVATQTLYSEASASKGVVEDTSIAPLAEADGTISGIEAEQYIVKHLTYTKAPYTVVYCKDYQTCENHDEMYTLEDSNGSGSEGGGAAGEEGKTSDESTYYFKGENGEQIALAVDKNLKTFAEAQQYGTNIEYKNIIYYDGKYYWVKQSQPVSKDTDLQEWVESYGVQLANEISTPSKDSKEGDICYKDGRYQVYAPYFSDEWAYSNPGYWITLE